MIGWKEIASGASPVYSGVFLWNDLCYDSDRMLLKEKCSMNTEILIIEDDEVIRKELQTLLNGNGYHTSVIEDFCNVTEQVRKLQPHLILLDVKLPQEKWVHNLCGIPQFFSGAIIFVTSLNTDIDERTVLCLVEMPLLQNRIIQQFCWQRLLFC